MKTSCGQNCKNHPAQKVLGSCHTCHDWLCRECLQEGPEHYYCHKPKCRRAFQAEARAKAFQAIPLCPSCGKRIKGGPRFCPRCNCRLKPVSEEEIDDLVTVARFGNALEAHLARTKLQSCGIQSYVVDEHIISLDPFRDIGWGGVKLKIRESDLEEAFKAFGGQGHGSVYTPPFLYAAAILFMQVIGFVLAVGMWFFAE